MWVSGREAAAILAPVLPSREMARRVLVAGLAVRPQRGAGALLYEEAAVRALLDWPVRGTAVPGFPRVLLVRLGATAPDQLEALTWAASALTRAELRMAVAETGRVPLVATTSGFVVRGADITAVHAISGGMALELSAPGSWFGAVERHRIPTPGGSRWMWWPPADATPRRRRPQETRWCGASHLPQ